MENYRIIKNDELYHHGIKGQKWGDRNGPPYTLDAGDHSAAEKKAGLSTSLRRRTSNVTKYGWKQGHAMNVANRIQENVRGNSKRIAMMSKRQQNSLKKAEEYWNARARGEDAPKRNIIARAQDSHRSFSAQQRAAKQMVINMQGQLNRQYVRNLNDGEKSPKELKYGQAAAASAMSTVANMAVEELIERAVGHY